MHQNMCFSEPTQLFNSFHPQDMQTPFIPVLEQEYFRCSPAYMFTSLETFRCFNQNHWRHFFFVMTIDNIYPSEINMCPHTVHIHRLSVFQEQNLEFEIHLLFRHRWKVNQLSTTFTDITQQTKFNSIFEVHLIYWVNSGQPSSICEPNERYQGIVRSTFKLSITGIYWVLSYGIDYNGAEFAVNCFRHMTQCVLPCSFWL